MASNHQSKKYSKCEDGGKHEGRLELMTWDSKKIKGEEKLGWGAVIMEEVEEHKESFIKKYKSNEEIFFKYWPQGFRWTCCGCVGKL